MAGGLDITLPPPDSLHPQAQPLLFCLHISPAVLLRLSSLNPEQNVSAEGDSCEHLLSPQPCLLVLLDWISSCSRALVNLSPTLPTWGLRAQRVIGLNHSVSLHHLLSWQEGTLITCCLLLLLSRFSCV